MSHHQHAPPPPPDVRVPRGVAPGTPAHAVLCALADDPTVMLDALAKDMGMDRPDLYEAMSKLRYHGLLDGINADRVITEKGKNLIRATVRGARV